MSIEPKNLTLVFLRRLDTKMDDVRADMQEVKERLGLVEAGNGVVVMGRAAYAIWRRSPH